MVEKDNPIILDEESEEEIEKQFSSNDNMEGKEIEELRKEVQEIKSVLGDKELSDEIEMEERIPFTGETKIQYNGSSYMSTIPTSIVRELNLRKTDRLRWRTIKYKGLESILITINYQGKEKELRAPFDKKVEE